MERTAITRADYGPLVILWRAQEVVNGKPTRVWCGTRFKTERGRDSAIEAVSRAQESGPLSCWGILDIIDGLGVDYEVLTLREAQYVKLHDRGAWSRRGSKAFVIF